MTFFDRTHPNITYSLYKNFLASNLNEKLNENKKIIISRIDNAVLFLKIKLNKKKDSDKPKADAIEIIGK